MRVASVLIPDQVLAGQPLTVSYQVINAGGATPPDQANWHDLIYLSRDRNLDLQSDRYLGYRAHTGGLAAGGQYDQTLMVTAPRDLEGTWYVFVVTDPASYGQSGENGRVAEFGDDDNNATTAAQPLLIETLPPADLVVEQVVTPASAGVGETVTLQYTILNDSLNTAYGRWTDAVYLSRDNEWDMGDILLGKVAHSGNVAGHEGYTGSLDAVIPSLKEGGWRIIVRPDIYNEVNEGLITYAATGVNLPPGRGQQPHGLGRHVDRAGAGAAVVQPVANHAAEWSGTAL